MFDKKVNYREANSCFYCTETPFCAIINAGVFT
jgi:hypothetical protein